MSCEHVPTLPSPAPDVPDQPRCVDCAALAESNWAHLRMCLSCGHVACCDSNPHRHATAHHLSTEHPVMRSAEPGESWRWCYLDRRLV